MKPVYVINGFLESGKTEFLLYTLDQPYFAIKGGTLLILCEEGEKEYSEKILKSTGTTLVKLDDIAEFTKEHLEELDKKYKPERIIIEWNGMWDFRQFVMAKGWRMEQQITTICAETFSVFFTNMRSLLAEQIRNSELIIFNRCDPNTMDINKYKRNIKAVNQRADVVFEDENGEVDQIMEDDLPYDMKAPVIELDDNGYAVWFLDIMDNMKRYEGKTISYIGQVMIPNRRDLSYCCVGRKAMTCCSQDISFLAYACVYDKVMDLKEKDWVKVTAVVKNEFWKDYNEEGPVLHVKSIEPAKMPAGGDTLDLTK